MLDQIILWVFLLATAVQLFYWLFFFSRLAFYQEPMGDGAGRTAGGAPQTAHGSRRTADGLLPTANCQLQCAVGRQPSAVRRSPSVSIIICAHNEEDNLRKNINRFLNQTYRSHELIIVLHKSSDNSLDVLSPLQRKFENIRVVRCDDKRVGKKFALAAGIEQAKNQVLLLTDADCVPASEEWVSGMIAGMDENTHIVLGFAPYAEAPGPLNTFIRFEACHTAMQYFSFSLVGIPYMGVGRNLAYRKELFERTGGFQRHEHLASGDDDLFVNAAASMGKVGIRLNPQTFVFSEAKKTWRDYYRQKTRHFSTANHYKTYHKVLLGILALSHGLHYLGAILVAFKISTIFALLGYAVRMCVVMTLSSLILRQLQHRSLLARIPMLDAALVIFYVIFAPATLMNTNTQRWN